MMDRRWRRTGDGCEEKAQEECKGAGGNVSLPGSWPGTSASGWRRSLRSSGAMSAERGLVAEATPVRFDTTLPHLFRATIGRRWNMALVRRPLLLRYGIVPPLVTLAALAQWVLLGPRAPFLMVLPAIIAVAWFGGLGPGLLATALGMLEVSYLFLEPRFSFRVGDPTEMFALVIFGFLGCSISLLCDRLIKSERARRQAEERALLETEDYLRVSR